MKKYLITPLVVIFLCFSCKNDDSPVEPIPHEEQFFVANVTKVTTSANSCDKILNILLDANNSFLAKDIDFDYEAYNVGEQFELRFAYLTPDTFYCFISGPIVGGDRDKAFPYINVLEVRDL